MKVCKKPLGHFPLHGKSLTRVLLYIVILLQTDWHFRCVKATAFRFLGILHGLV